MSLAPSHSLARLPGRRPRQTRQASSRQAAARKRTWPVCYRKRSQIRRPNTRTQPYFYHSLSLATCPRAAHSLTNCTCLLTSYAKRDAPRFIAAPGSLPDPADAAPERAPGRAPSLVAAESGPERGAGPPGHPRARGPGVDPAHAWRPTWPCHMPAVLTTCGALPTSDGLGPQPRTTDR